MVIEKCTELGVTDYYILRSEYTNARNDIEKLQRIAISASEQSERLDVPAIHEEQRLNEFITNLPDEYMWFSAIERDDEAISILDISPENQNIGFIVGPEGGFSGAEKLLLQRYTTPIRLSHNILKTETSAMICCAIAGIKRQIQEKFF